MKLYRKFNPETYYSRDLFAVVCATNDLRPVWAKVNSLNWGVDYETYLNLCKLNCPCCNSKLNYGLGKNNLGKKDYETPSTDHIIPKSYGGTNDINNLWIICERCNRFKNNATYDDVERIKNIAKILEETKINHLSK
jgi:5-methylcytosine-specific restriction endonuclease McrA